MLELKVLTLLEDWWMSTSVILTILVVDWSDWVLQKDFQWDAMGCSISQ